MSKETDDLVDKLRRAWGVDNEELVEPVARAAEQGLSKPLSERHNGALLDGAKSVNVPLGDTRRKFLTVSLQTLGHAGAVLSGAAALGTAYQIVHEHKDDMRTRYNVRRQFETRVEAMTYLERNAITDIDLNPGETAILDSIDAYRHGQINRLHAVQRELRLAAEITEDPQARTLAIWRLMVDSSFFGEGKDANAYLHKVDFEQLDLELKFRLLDAASATALNLMSPGEFVVLQSDAYDHVASAWEGLNISSPEEVKQLYKEGRVGALTTAIQHTNIQKVRHAGMNRGQRSDARTDWFNDLLQLTQLLSDEPAAQAVALDFLLSMTRLTFHSAADGDYDQVGFLLDYYFRRASDRSSKYIRSDLKPDSENIAGARGTIEQEWTANSPWMLLLDLKTHSRPWATDRLKTVLKNKQLRLASPQLKKAFHDTGSKLGFSTDELARALRTNQLEAQVPQTTLLQPYLDQISRLEPW